jgi:hypothetical protein
VTAFVAGGGGELPANATTGEIGNPGGIPVADPEGITSFG